MNRIDPRAAATAAVALAAMSFASGAFAAHVCLTPAEAREAVAQEQLASFAAAQREAASRGGGDPLRGRLCRWNNDLVYEITLLRRDGRLTHVYVMARDGLVIDRPSE